MRRGLFVGRRGLRQLNGLAMGAKSMKPRLHLWTLALGAVCVACGLDESTSIDDACADMCDNLAACLDWDDDERDECEEGCVSDFDNGNAGDACLDATIDGLLCVADLSCAEVDGDDLGDCEDELVDAQEACGDDDDGDDNGEDDAAALADLCTSVCENLEACDLADYAQCADGCAEEAMGVADLGGACVDGAAGFYACVQDMVCADLEAAFVDYDFGACMDAAVEFGAACDDACCTEDNACDWANDGYCDCGGELSWDAADCAADTAPPSP